MDRSGAWATRSTSTATSTSTAHRGRWREIQADIQQVEKEILTMLREVAG